MNTCADTANRAIKAYAADFWDRVTKAYLGCDAAQRPMVKAEITTVLDRLKTLLERQGN